MTGPMIRLRTFGGGDLTDAQGLELRPILAQPKRLVLLVYLALAGRSRFRRRDTLVAFFWPELDQAHARGALRQALTFLRRTLGEGIIATRGDEEIGIDPSGLACDAVEFESLAADGRAAEAMALYVGDFLEGVFISDAAPELEQWMDGERARLRGLATQAAWRLAEGRREAGDRAGAAAWGRRAAAFSPNDEGELRRLVELLDALGDRAGAIQAYEEFARRLAANLEVEPSPATQGLMHAVRRRQGVELPREAGQATDTVPPPARPAASPPRGLAPPGLRGRRALLTLAVAGLLAVGGYLAAFSQFRPRRLTVAVLPVEDLGGDTASLYVANGVTHQLITDLALIGTLDVISSNTMIRYRGSSKTVAEIARERGAGAVVASTIQGLGDTVRMTSQLTLANEDRVIWGQTYEGNRGDLLRMQREAARAIAVALRRSLTPVQQAGLARTRPIDPDALDLYVKGRHWWNRRGRAALLESIRYFQQALDIDPTFALAYAGMADAYVQLGYGSLLRPDDAFPKARGSARRALELDSTLAEPHATLGYVQMYNDWNWTAADSEFRRAIELSPGYATAHEWYGLFLTAMGRFDDALAHERRAQELDPLSVAVAGTAAWVLNYSGRLDEAEREARIVLREDSAFALGHFYLGRILQAKGELDSALVHYAATGPLREWVPTIAGYGYVYALQGRRRDAEAVLAHMDSMSRHEYVTAYAVALVHAALGQVDSAFVWLDHGVAERTHWLVWLRWDPRWKPLRADPRFEDLARRVGLPP
ncbi:MAG: BTAD domain-containing putative transcriptional regulator [Anaerolineales bacterium]